VNTGEVLRLEKPVKRFGTKAAVDNVDLALAPDEVVALIGPSGCGKSTLLRCITWLEPPDSGFVHLAGHPFGRERGPFVHECDSALAARSQPHWRQGCSDTLVAGIAAAMSGRPSPSRLMLDHGIPGPVFHARVERSCGILRSSVCQEMAF